MAKKKNKKLASGKNPLQKHSGTHLSHKSTSKNTKVSKISKRPKTLTTTSHSRPTIPFTSSNKILLVGEGDFSHALSVLENHLNSNGANLVATCYDNAAELEEKYPQAVQTVEALKTKGVRVLYEVDAGKLKKNLGKKALNGEQDQVGAPVHVRNEEEPGIDVTVEEIEDGSSQDYEHKMSVYEQGCRRRPLKKSGTSSCYDRIIFNFPHVGGKSTDVNRQVRANQELLVQFFRSAKLLLNISSNSGGGQIITTLFEGEPYSLWNVRDLARHCGLKVVTSFRFPWESYPGYRHARTLGNIKSKGGETSLKAHDHHERRGWKGEERDARSFVFETSWPSKNSDERQNKTGKKRNDESSSGDEDE